MEYILCVFLRCDFAGKSVVRRKMSAVFLGSVRLSVVNKEYSMNDHFQRKKRFC